MVDARQVSQIQDAVLGWFATGARPLAWRTTTDPYRIMVSEIMLQQTQASRVEPLFEAFCERFPTVADLASAPASEVLTAWRGLGYNRRAVALHRAAKAVVADHGGQVPSDYEALRSLPGIGEYTARAVQVFSFGLPAAPVDTNIARVLRRAVVGAALATRPLQALADEMVPDDPGAWSGALMDLGARHCTARTPRCADCPLASLCTWRTEGGPDPAATSRPSAPAFGGSDRFHRGRLVDALREGPVAGEDLASAARTDDRRRARLLADRLVADGLAEWDGARLRLPA